MSMHRYFDTVTTIIAIAGPVLFLSVVLFVFVFGSRSDASADAPADVPCADSAETVSGYDTTCRPGQVGEVLLYPKGAVLFCRCPVAEAP
jgi:hypothetical protein